MTEINQYNEKGERHGYWEVYYGKGKLHYKGNYHNGKAHGYWENYHTNGNLWFKGDYNNGNPIGYWEWHVNGELYQQIFYT